MLCEIQYVFYIPLWNIISKYFFFFERNKSIVKTLSCTCYVRVENIVETRIIIMDEDERY